MHYPTLVLDSCTELVFVTNLFNHRDRGIFGIIGFSLYKEEICFYRSRNHSLTQHFLFIKSKVNTKTYQKNLYLYVYYMSIRDRGE